MILLTKFLHADCTSAVLADVDISLWLFSLCRDAELLWVGYVMPIIMYLHSVATIFPICPRILSCCILCTYYYYCEYVFWLVLF